MKTCDEMVNSLLKRREQFILEQSQRRKTVVKIASAGGSCALAGIIGVGILSSGITRKKETVISDNSSVISGTSSSESSEFSNEDSAPQAPDFSSVIWAEPGVDDKINFVASEVGAFDEFNGKVITRTLSETFSEHSDDSVFAVAVFYFPYEENIDKDFVYNGKKLAQYDEESLAKWQRSMDLFLIRNNAEYLINGEEYYQTNIWTKYDYDNAISLLGERQELVSEYFVDGEFLKDKLYQDIDIASEEYHASYATYNEAYNAWKTSMLERETERLGALGINCELRNSPDSFIAFVTKDKFAALAFDDSGNWFFGLALEKEIDVLGEYIVN